MSDHNYHGQHDAGRRGGGRGRRIGCAAVVLAVLAGGGYVGYTKLSGPDRDVTAATERVREFLDAWAADAAAEAGRATDSPEAASSLVESVMTNLGPERTVIRVDEAGVSESDVGVTVPFEVSMSIPEAGELEYASRATAVEREGEWLVDFDSPVVHPDLEAGQTLALKTVGARGTILDADGEELTAASLTGTVDDGGRGVSGLQARYEEELTRGLTNTRSVVIVDRESNDIASYVTETESRNGEDIRTTIDPRVQQAAALALEEIGDKRGAIVAIDPTDGDILAAASRPGGMNRAFEGAYPPGSTFKVVTSTALLKSGMAPDTVVECPKFARVNGQTFENQDQFTLPEGSTFRDSFAHSCNTFFVDNREKVSGTALRQAAGHYGVGAVWDVGAATYDGSVPDPETDNELAASTIGQGRLLASPLVMASVAATVKEGSFKQPVLVPDQVEDAHSAPPLPADIAASLRAMMRATVTEGAGKALSGIPGEPHAKTGTAEYGDAVPPATHAWMIGYQGTSDIAWSVLIEDGGSGGKDAGPVAAAFLRGLD
ncbi:penicillin-binding transpeptidase domain-containing protein [Streptomyces sp. ZYX-F-203]